MLRVGFQPPPPSSFGTDTGRTLALPMVQDLVGLDLQGFYKVSPAVKLGLAFLFFSLSAAGNNIFWFSAFFLKSTLHCPPMPCCIIVCCSLGK